MAIQDTRNQLTHDGKSEASLALADADIVQRTPPEWLTRQAKSLILRGLSGLQGGQLILHDGAERYLFGQVDTAAPLVAEITVLDRQFYRQVILGGSLGAAESHLAGQWHSPHMEAVIRLLARNLPWLDRIEQRFAWATWPLRRWISWRDRNSLQGSKRNIMAHYDLGNALYQRFLDPLMQYSSAIYPSASSSLAEAQCHKLRLICDKLELGPQDHLLEIGTGWGELAIFAAREYGCRVTTTTISDAQHAYAARRIAEEGLEQRIQLLKQDYRLLDGQFDKLVSVEMIEAVGHHYLPTFFQTLQRLLRPGGRLLLQAITIDDRRYDTYRRGVDFIQRYIFPGGCLPSVSRMTELLKRETDMTLVRLMDYGPHYARTLREWAQRFEAQSQALAELGYGDEFRRLWHFYFAYCAGGFAERSISLVHFEAARPGPLSWQGGLEPEPER